MAGECKYSCETAAESLEWIHAIIDFIKPYNFFWEAHGVNFFKDRLWEAVDKDWIDCLRNESGENLLQIPSGVVQDNWPASLKQFILTLRSLALPREQADLKKVFPELEVTSLNNVLTQGMNRKKKHEIEALASIVSSVAQDTETNTIIDVGAGQGYLSQVLSFQYQLSVIAIDASSHHGRITDARAERIKKHYAANMRKSCAGERDLTVPKTVTCRVLSTDMLKAFTNSNDAERQSLIHQDVAAGKHPLEGFSESELPSSSYADPVSSLLLTGLHACGDLSVTMLRTFLECKEVKAVVSIGCCYNLLSEEGVEKTDSQCGFPMSKGVKSAGLLLGKSSRDLACQSADRWRSMGKDAGLENFELHAFRAAFQMVLSKHFPEILIKSPTIGRQGKALRRRQQQRMLEPSMHCEETTDSPPLFPRENSNVEGSWPTMKCATSEIGEKKGRVSNALCYDQVAKRENTKLVEKCLLFEKFCLSGLSRLSLPHTLDIDFAGLWKEVEPLVELIGPYWSLRAALGPVLETLLLLDRLLFLQEKGKPVEVVMLPIFDPSLSPRNMALIAKKT